MSEESEWTSADGETVQVISEVNLNDEQYQAALNSRAEFATMSGWVRSTQAPTQASLQNNARNQRSGGLLARDRYVTPEKIFEQFKVARLAAENDDIVLNSLATTEALVFNKVRVECGDDDEENIWDQILRDIRMDAHLREMWRELFIYNQYYLATILGNKTYKVEGIGTQRARRKTFDLLVPRALSLLDPLKVIPVGDFLFDQDNLAYISNRDEGVSIDDVIAGKNTSDQVVTSLITSRYVPSRSEAHHLEEVTGATNLTDLFLLNPALVWRHTGTRASYARFADVSMKSIFELLDLKRQLRQNDRAHLIGSTNFIVLIRKGDKDRPATNAELASLNNSAQMVGRTPLLIGDHRLSVDIITPDMDDTLDPKRYNNIDSRITASLYHIFHIGGFSAGASGDDSLKLARVIARGLESRRQMIKENLEQRLLIPIFEANDALKCKPRLEFTPRNVSLDFDPNFLQTMLDLYSDGAISRETILGVVDHEQEEEFARRTIEKERYDTIMKPRDTSQTLASKTAGRRQGGNANGGGNNPDSRRSNPIPRRSDNDIPGDSDSNDQ